MPRSTNLDYWSIHLRLWRSICTQGLRQQIRQLRIEIDEAKRQKQVDEIVETDFFQDLQVKRVRIARARRAPGRMRRGATPWSRSHESGPTMIAFADLQRQLGELAAVKGIAPVDLLQLPAAMTPVFRKMMRQGLTLAELAQELDLSLDQARQVGDLLVDKGFLTSQQQGDSGDTIYTVRFARMRGQIIAVDL